MHLDDPDEGLGANTGEELAHLEAVSEARDMLELRRIRHDEES